MILLTMAKRERSVRLSPLPSRRLLISFDIGPLSIGLEELYGWKSSGICGNFVFFIIFISIEKNVSRYFLFLYDSRDSKILQNFF